MSKSPPHKYLQWALLLLGTALLAATAGTLWPAATADFATARARAGVAQWRSHPRPVALNEWGAWRNELARGLAQTPADSQLHDAMGYLYGAYALQAKAAPDLARDFYQQAYTSFNHAATLRPMSADLAQNAGLAARLSAQPDLKVWGRFWDCRAVAYTARGVALSPYLNELKVAECR
jgi:hypothetical protein